MANPTCNTATLFEANPGFGQNFSERQFQAAMIYFMVKELAANGGTDYSAVMTSTLISDALALVGRSDRNQRHTGWLNIAYNNAVSAGATVPDADALSDINALTGCCFQNEQVDFDAIMLLLACKLGVHKDYPQ